MKVTLIEWAVAVVIISNVLMTLAGILFGEGTPEQQKQQQTQSAPAPSKDEIQSDWK